MDKSNEQAACNGDQHEDPIDNMDEEAAAKEKLTADPSKVKFTSVNLDGYDSKNGEAKVDIHLAQTTVGMGKEELMKYANEPFWVRLRMFLFVFFWFSWIAMLVGAVVIIMVAPRCPPPPTLEWFQKSPMYQVEVKTFKDSNSDGIGDFKGLMSKLDYFKMHHIGTLMLSAFYQSSDTDGIIDHKKVDDKLGSLEDFDEFLDQLNKTGIKLIVDFNPNHSSNQHQWFIDSVEGKEPYKDYYIWSDTKTNWLNVESESAWVFNNQRNQYYLATFGEDKPDLNLRNENVRNELKEILRYWLDKGVDGFKVIAASHLIEHADIRDEPLATTDSVENPKYEELNHIYTLNQPENLDLFIEWKEILNNASDTPESKKILIAEVSETNHTLIYPGNYTNNVIDLPIITEISELKEGFTGIDLREAINSRSNLASKTAWPTFLVGSKTTKRLATRVGKDLVDGIHMAAFLAKGTPITYYGDELGMTDLKEHEEHMVQSFMLWSNETNAGFSNSSASLNIHPDYETLNVEAQAADYDSHLNIFKRLLALRGHPALSFGIQEYPLVTNETFSMIRVRKGSPAYLVILNVGSESTELDFSGKNKYLPEKGRLEIRSRNVVSEVLTMGQHPKLYLNDIKLGPKEAVVVSFVPVIED